MQAKVWGVHLYYLERKIKHAQLKEVAEKDLKAMPKDLEETARMAKGLILQATQPANIII